MNSIYKEIKEIHNYTPNIPVEYNGLLYRNEVMDLILKKVSITGLYHALYPQNELRTGMNGKYKSGDCPFHASSPIGSKHRYIHFYLFEEQCKYVCYGCGQNGDAFDLLVHYLKNTYDLDNINIVVEALSLLSGFSLAISDDLSKQIYEEIKEHYITDWKEKSKVYTKNRNDSIRRYIEINDISTFEAVKKAANRLCVNIRNIEQVRQEMKREVEYEEIMQIILGYPEVMDFIDSAYDPTGIETELIVAICRKYNISLYDFFSVLRNMKVSYHKGIKEFTDESKILSYRVTCRTIDLEEIEI